MTRTEFERLNRFITENKDAKMSHGYCILYDRSFFGTFDMSTIAVDLETEEVIIRKHRVQDKKVKEQRVTKKYTKNVILGILLRQADSLFLRKYSDYTN